MSNSVESVTVPAKYQEACWVSVDDRFWGVVLDLSWLCYRNGLQSPRGPTPPRYPAPELTWDMFWELRAKCHRIKCCGFGTRSPLGLLKCGWRAMRYAAVLDAFSVGRPSRAQLLQPGLSH